MLHTLETTHWGLQEEMFGGIAIENVADNEGMSIDEIKEAEAEWDLDIRDQIEIEAECYNNEMGDCLDAWEKNCPGFVLKGRLGLWNRKPEVVDIEINLDELLDKCLRDNCDYTINYVDGHLEVINNHHDGTNVFCIYPINEKGLGLYDDWTYSRLDGALNTMREDQIIDLILMNHIHNETLYTPCGKLHFWYNQK